MDPRVRRRRLLFLCAVAVVVIGLALIFGLVTNWWHAVDVVAVCTAITMLQDSMRRRRQRNSR